MRTAWAAGLLVLTSPLGGQAVPPPIPVIADVAASVRSAGLGGAATGLPGYAAVVFDNPSAIGPIRVLSVEGAYAQGRDDLWYATAAAVARTGPVNIGGGYRYLRFDDGGPVQDNLLATFATTYRRGGAYLGASGKYVSVEDSSGKVFRTISQDVGATLAFFDIAALGFSVQNLSPESLDGPTLDLPTTTRLGFSLNLIDNYSKGRLLLVTESVWTDGDDRRTVLGVEAGMVFSGVGVVGRIGTGRQSRVANDDATSYGGSLVLSRARLDYAYQRRNAVSRRVHSVGLRWTP
ncbi:MAG: hypothetical protein SFU57_07920 [Gemmatimonadales bacterium]|nr:hypothetical protein [Gemmatimonadales bacterium]